MHLLRTSSLLACLVMAWFVLTLGVAIASPLVHPQTMELVCTGGSNMKLIVMGDDGNWVDVDHHTLDCPLCLVANMPPPATQTLPELPQPLGHALQPIVAARIAALVGAPLPARGPPLFS